jgi:hemolysin III
VKSRIEEIGTTDVSARASHPRLESLSEWRVDALVHVVGVTLGIAACLALAIVVSQNAGFAVLATLAVYGAGLLAMLGCSAVYHIGGRGPRKAIWRRLDHAAMFVMIAGTYTPFLAIAIGGAWSCGLQIPETSPCAY